MQANGNTCSCKLYAEIHNIQSLLIYNFYWPMCRAGDILDAVGHYVPLVLLLPGSLYSVFTKRVLGREKSA
jgi:hypothetical protein